MSRSQQVRAKNDKGDEVAISTHDTDSPILPVAQLEKLHQFRPDLVDFVIEQTRCEAEFRRSISFRTNKYIFIERILGMFCALFLGVFGIVGGGYVGLHGEPYLGGGIVTAALTTLAVAFIKKNSQENPKKETPQKK